VIVNVRGILEAVGPDWVHVQVGGVTLQVFVPASSIGELGPLGEQVNLHTQLRVRDEAPILYGFTTPASSEMFQLLNGVSGVGPRLALALLSGLSAARLQQAIASADVATLSSAPGVGRRTASRIVLDLKGKVEVEEAGAIASQTNDDIEVIAALTALGYSTNEATRAVSNLERGPDLTLEDRVRLALQQFGASG
jgi:Holliday junction DNA helicase RuvA